jgi:outer membrane lipoprotein-sorting protein
MLFKLLIIMLFFSSAVTAAPSQTVLKQAQTHLNKIRSMKAAFTQVAPNGQISNGTLYIKRAGKMRWEYSPPTPIIMVTSGNFLRYYDHKLEQISDIPIAGTIAAYLAKNKINFSDNDIKVLEAVSDSGVQMVRITSRKNPDEGEISFVFSEKPYKLKNILTKDSKGLETTIALQDAEYNILLNDELFEILDPNIDLDKRNRHH